jgi:NADPH:quinone reductase-like Zn-dependent oxidoreductase
MVFSGNEVICLHIDRDQVLKVPAAAWSRGWGSGSAGGARHDYTWHLRSAGVPIVGKGVDMSFGGKVVLVTGSTSGIGEACARLFAESGAAVMVCGRNAARGRQVVDEIGAAGGIARFTAVDLRAEEARARVSSMTRSPVWADSTF